MQTQINDGVWGHSSKAGGEKYVIFSHTSPTFMKNVLEQMNIRHKQLIGCYKGIEEVSFIINYKDFTQKIENLLAFNQQESILILGECDARDKRPAILKFLKTGQTRDLGLMQSVSEDEAKAQDAWTYDMLQKKYFIAK